MPAAFPLSDAQNKSDEAGRRGSMLPGGRTGLLAGGAAPQGAAVHVIQHVDYSSIIFIGTVFYYLTGFMTKEAAFLESSIIILTTTIALALLFFFAEKGKFYPAMPIISAGCFVGYILTLLI